MPSDSDLKAFLQSLAHDHDLRSFQQRLRDHGFFKAFASLLPSAMPPNPDNADTPLVWPAIKNCQLLLTRLWSPLAEDEKVSGYILDESLQQLDVSYDKLNLLAAVVFEIVGRNNTLSERMVRSAARLRRAAGHDSVLFNIRHLDKQKQPFRFGAPEGAKKSYDIRYSTTFRATLIKYPAADPKKALDLSALFNGLVTRFLTRPNARASNYPALARALRRELRNDQNLDFLEHARKNALALIVNDGKALDELRAAVALFSDPPLPDDEERHLDARTALVHEYSSYLDFLAVIQASLLFAPWHHHSSCLFSCVDQHKKSFCMVAIGSAPIANDALLGSSHIAKQFLEIAVHIQDELKDVQKSRTTAIERHLLSLEKPDSAIAQQLIIGDADSSDSAKRYGRLQLLARQLVAHPAFGKADANLLGVGVLASFMGEVSRVVHEGLQCRFLVLFGPGACWRLFRETISREERPQLPLSDILKSNYSIFQHPLVAGFVDRNVYPEGQGLSYLGRLTEEPDGPWMRRSTDRYPGLYVLNCPGDGVVHIYGKGELLAKWRHDAGLLEEPKTLDFDLLEQFLTTGRPYAKELFEAICQIEETPGEGALVILSETTDVVAHLSPMEPPGLQMAWAQIDSLEHADLMLIRALLRRDGASVIDSAGGMLLRQLVFPVDKERNSAVTIQFADQQEGKRLLGRGARHYTAECLSRVLGEASHIIALSVDGGVKMWRGRRHAD